MFRKTVNELTFYVIWLALLQHGLQNVQCDGIEKSITDCLNRKFDTKLELPLEIVNEKGELELWIHNNDKYDLYQTYNTGQIYHYELQIAENLTPRNGANRANCSNYLISEPNWYGCPYKVTEDEHQVNITVESFLRSIIYSIDKTTKEVVYLPETTGLYGPTQEQGQIDCVNQVSNYSIELPIEVNRKENHLEVTVKYQGKYDFYNTISLGSICGIQYQFDEKPNPTIEEYAHCSKCGNSAELYTWCPFKITEDENAVTITLEAFFYKNIYTVDKYSKEVHYEKSLVGKDPQKEFEENISQCKDGLSTKNISLPVQIIRNDNFLEIWVKRNDKFDFFETYVSGSVCKLDLQSSRDPSILVPRAPAECFTPGLDVPYYFLCPYNIAEDDDYFYFTVYASNIYLYAFNKSSGELVYRKLPIAYDSSHQGTVTYLRSAVLDANFF